MSDKWCHTHETAIHGPVSGDELARLVQTGGVLPTDMVWPDGTYSAKAVPAQTALQFLKAVPADAGAVAAARPPPWRAATTWLHCRARRRNPGSRTSAASKNRPPHPSRKP